MIVLGTVLLVLAIIGVCAFIYIHRLPHYKGAGIALFYKGDRGYEVLLGRRKYNPGIYKWSIPGGGFERYDRSLLDTAKREFTEELSYPFDKINTTLVKNYKIKLPHFTWHTYCYLIHEKEDFTKRYISEFSLLRYIPLDELKNYKLNTIV